jgi:hypothetical protein
MHTKATKVTHSIHQQTYIKHEQREPGYLHVSLAIRLSTAPVVLISKAIKTGLVRHKAIRSQELIEIHINAADLIQLINDNGYSYSEELKGIASQITREPDPINMTAISHPVPGNLPLSVVCDHIKLSDTYITKHCDSGEISTRVMHIGGKDAPLISVVSLMHFLYFKHGATYDVFKLGEAGCKMLCKLAGIDQYPDFNLGTKLQESELQCP